MKLLLLTAIALVSVTTAVVLFENNLDNEWKSFKKAYGRNYQDSNEESYRRSIFEARFKRIEIHNVEAKEGKHSFTQRINKFSDMTNEEFRKTMNGFKSSMKAPEKEREFYKPVKNSLPPTIDWRRFGFVTPIKDQGQCGSCWAFSAVASLEGQHFNKTGDLVSLSEQNLVDCSSKQGNQGCDGGLMDQAFQYIKLNNGIDTEDSYPYEASDGKCKYDVRYIGATCAGFVDIKSGSEEDLQDAVFNVGPIAVAIDASQDSFQSYDQGVYHEGGCGNTADDLDHGVTVVGFGFVPGKKPDYYYIVKNSWGDDWGQDGYIWMARNENNECGIATMASYPLV